MNDRILDSAVWRSALMWKEFRQVAPLALTVLCLAMGMLFLILLTNHFTSSSTADASQFIFVFLSVPMIYSCGVGILLVGHEKESRSLRWFQSLPVASRDIAWSKLLVAIASLAMIWMVTSIAWFLFASFLRIDPFLSRGVLVFGLESLTWMFVTYVAFSIFLSLAGLGLAWCFHSSMVSLLLLIPSALAVWLPAYGFTIFFETSDRALRSQFSADWGTQLACVAVGCVFALALGWIASQRELSARSAPRSNSGWLGLKVAMRSEGTAESWTLWPRMTSGAGMLWQMVRQSWMLWIIVVLFSSSWLWIAGPMRLFDYSDNYIARSFFPRDSSVPFWMIGSLLILWMGVFVYQGDGMQQRVRFYADRGVSPSLLWWTRHWIPLTILLGLGLVRFWSLSQGHSLNMVETFAGMAIALAIYIIGQWVSQLIASPMISAIAAPIVAVAMGLFCISAVALMGAPWWIFIATFAFLLGATWWMMKPWMERRIDWRYYLQHGVFAAIALTIPWLPGLWEIWKLPSMALATRAELVRLVPESARLAPDALAKTLEPFYAVPHFLDEGQGSAEALLNSNEQARQSYRQTLTRRAGDAGFWMGSLNSIYFQLEAFQAELSSLRMEIESLSALSATSSASAIEDYRSILSHVPQIVQTLREKRSLLRCDLAERIELVALRECLQPKARDKIGDVLYPTLLKFLANGQARDDARRKALASDWYDQSQIDALSWLITYHLLGDYYIDLSDFQSYRFTGAIPLAARLARERDLLVGRLWDLLDSAPGSTEAMAKRAVYREQFLRQRDDLCDVVDGVFFIPARWYEPAITWRGEWETIANDLVSKEQDRE